MIKAKTPKILRHRYKPILVLLGVFALLLFIALLAFRLSPWPGALIIRAVFNNGGHKTLEAMEKQVPPLPIEVLSDQQYTKTSKDALLDVYIPKSATRVNQKLPVVVWTHGGAWLSGNKKDAAPYFKFISSQGFVVVVPNYSLAPGKTYPTQIHQLNDAHKYMQANAGRFHIDTGKVILAGDSAGSQLSSQMAVLITNPEYAKALKIKPSLSSSQLAGVVLFCGIYKMEGLTTPDPALPKIVSWGDDVAVWAYTGSRDKSDPVIREMSAYYHADKNFPSTFISGGNADPLTVAQSIPFAARLQSMGVDVTTLFYPANHRPALPHEYQFTLDADGRQAFAQMIRFLSEKTR